MVPRLTCPRARLDFLAPSSSTSSCLKGGATVPTRRSISTSTISCTNPWTRSSSSNPSSRSTTSSSLPTLNRMSSPPQTDASRPARNQPNHDLHRPSLTKFSTTPRRKEVGGSKPPYQKIGQATFEQAMRDAKKRSPPEQRWSNRTLIMLSTTVGAITFMIGMNQGYKAGKNNALEEVALGKASPPSPPPPQNVTPGSLECSPSDPDLPLSTSSVDILDKRPSSRSNRTTPDSDGCHLSEMVQYHCELEPNRIVCRPIDRIFRK
ncbi:hypothetical protein IE53DRAFT_371551 [Violaceomyces palustris]|uniref:Uncharacterized protein n=1 Tax=Violaceomyces palustris TaxID=1673888 RepID=A0ACD0NNH3_9BASI|nr:hypothetical protein IE53DRAFT_371551 [Violaceomyces palustris]